MNPLLTHTLYQSGETCLHNAVQQGHFNIVAAIIQAQKKPEPLINAKNYVSYPIVSLSSAQELTLCLTLSLVNSKAILHYILLQQLVIMKWLYYY